MAVTVVGSVAFDSLETPFGRRERILGGAALTPEEGAELLNQRVLA